MSSIVYWTNKANGRTYAYRSESYWDKEKKQPRSKRTYLGRVDPETGEIIKGERKTKTATRELLEREPADVDNEAIRTLMEKVRCQEEELTVKQKQIQELEARLQKAQTAVSALASTVGLKVMKDTGNS